MRSPEVMGWIAVYAMLVIFVLTLIIFIDDERRRRK